MKSWATTYIPPLADYDVPTLRLFNVLTGSIEELNDKQLSMYVCGITPYDATHLGHAATYLTFDVINRYARFSGMPVTYIQNITDVDDPLLERANRDSINWEDLAADQISLFRDDMTALRVLPPDHYMGAVETIPWVIDAIEQLQERGAVYKIDNDFYFSIQSDSNFHTYTKLSLAEQMKIFGERGGDPDREGKRHPLDCLIWRGARPGEPSWPSPFGAGRPGWHIECTAIALKFLDAPISIQGGGSDLHFPHHSMCAAEGRILTGVDFAKRFIHTGMIGLDGEKMSKSRGNLKFVSVMRNESVDVMALRIALLSGHYRTDRSWSDELLETAQARLTLWRRAIASPYGGEIRPVIDKVIHALSSDLDTPRAFAAIDSWASGRVDALTVNTGDSDDIQNIGQFARFLDAVLGIAL